MRVKVWCCGAAVSTPILERHHSQPRQHRGFVEMPARSLKHRLLSTSQFFLELFGPLASACDFLFVSFSNRPS